MSKFPIICGIIGKKLYLTILLALIMISHSVFKRYFANNQSIPLINNLGGSVIEMLSIFIPCIFKFKGKTEKSSRKCTKANFIDYFILFVIILSNKGINKLIEFLDINALAISSTWIFSGFILIFNLFFTIIMLKAKYYIHNIISMVLCCIFSVIIDLITGNLKNIKLSSFIYLIPGLLQSLLLCYEKYLMDKKYHSYWNVLFFIGLDYFIIYSINFIIIIIIDPNNNLIFYTIRNSEKKNIIINFFMDAILDDYLKVLLTLLVLEYFSVNHELISEGLCQIVRFTISIISYYKKYTTYLLFLIPAFFQIISLLFYLEILEFNFCNLNKNTKRNIMLREEAEILLRNNTNISDIEFDNNLIVKMPEEKNLELNTIVNEDKEEKDDDNSNKIELN